MDDFLIDVEYDGNSYVANYFSGKTIQLDATNYHDAIMEADTLNVEEYE